MPRDGSPVYCAGPMFSKADLNYQLLIRDVLVGAGFTTYVPQTDGIEIASVMGDINDPPPLPPALLLVVHDFVRKLVFGLDIYQLMERCKAVVFNIDGRVPDDGSVMEASVAWAAGKPLVIHKTTPVTMLGGFDNPMVAGLAMGWQDVNTLDELPAAVDLAVAQRESQNPDGPPFRPDAHAQKVIDLGAAVWAKIGYIHTIPDMDPPEMQQAVEQLMRELGPLVEEATEAPTAHRPSRLQRQL